MRPSKDSIIDAVLRVLPGVTRRDVMSGYRGRDAVRARAMIAYLFVKLHGDSFPAVARALNLKSHGAAHRLVRTVELQPDSILADALAALRPEEQLARDAAEFVPKVRGGESRIHEALTLAADVKRWARGEPGAPTLEQLRERAMA